MIGFCGFDSHLRFKMSNYIDSTDQPCPFCLSNERYDRQRSEERYGYAIDEITQKMVMQIKHKPTCARFRHCMSCNTGDWITGMWGLCRDCLLKMDEDRDTENLQES